MRPEQLAESEIRKLAKDLVYSMDVGQQQMFERTLKELLTKIVPEYLVYNTRKFPKLPHQ